MDNKAKKCREGGTQGVENMTLIYILRNILFSLINEMSPFLKIPFQFGQSIEFYSWLCVHIYGQISAVNSLQFI